MPRPKLPLISRRSAVQAALQIIDSEGLDSFSLEKLARHMGVKSPSLYHHFTNKHDLLEAVATELLSDIPLGNSPVDDEWQEWFVRLSLRTYQHVMRHPRAASLLLAYFPSSSVMPAHERGVQILADHGVSEDMRYPIVRSLEKILFGLVFADATELMHGQDHLPHGVDQSKWPNLAKAVKAVTASREQLVEHAVRIYLKGVAQAHVNGSGG